jgi:hypothetical protein
MNVRAARAVLSRFAGSASASSLHQHHKYRITLGVMDPGIKATTAAAAASEFAHSNGSPTDGSTD